MNRRIRGILVVVGIALVAAIISVLVIRSGKAPDITKKEVHPHRGMIKTFVSTTGTILPYNRLEIKPPINGRVEQIFVREGDRVWAGQTLLLMSSTDRAALIDAARSQGGDQLKYWEGVYKPIPLVAPITGTVIVRAMEPGQTATTAQAIIVISDRLIVKASVDETDIGRVSVGQTAEISMDAYPEVKANGRVDLIKYESVIVNNVTTYEVDIVPDTVPPVFRSGMSANINIFDVVKKDVLLIPNEAITKENNETHVLVGKMTDKRPEKRLIKTGLNDDQNIEILSGLSEGDTVIIVSKKFLPTDASKGNNPFMPPKRK